MSVEWDCVTTRNLSVRAHIYKTSATRRLA